jgi:hypothetical protein
MKIHHIIVGIFCSCTVLTSCKNPASGDRKAALVHVDSRIEFADNELDSVINEYVSRYEVAPKERVLSLQAYRDPARHIYYLTQIRTKKLVKTAHPDYFFLHNDQFLVLLRLGGSDFYKSGDATIQLDSAMQKLAITLAEDSLDYDPPTWELIKDCGGKLRRRQKSDFALNYLPCGYEIMQDSLHQSNFFLQRQSINGDLENAAKR